jgi:anti-sigma factor RsiW
MTTMSCQQLAEVADELALDVLAGDVRAVALEHLDDCPACRATVEGLSETADALLFAHGAIEPPPGFADRVLARLALERTPARRRPPRRLLVAAAAVVVALALAGVGVAALRSGGHDEPVASGSDAHTVRLISASGEAVGDVSAYSGRESWFWMRVDHGVASGTYQCVLDVPGRPAIPIGALTVTDGTGAWGASLAITAPNVRDARLVAPDGSTVATATFQ